MQSYTIKSLYAFSPLDPQQLSRLSTELSARAEDHCIVGLVILGKEGFNSTLAAQEPSALELFLADLLKILGVSETSLIKTSYSQKRPFRRFDIKIRAEIVTLEREDFVPSGDHRHISPTKWQEMMQQQDVVVIDTRNTYETKIGKFKNAVDLKIDEFAEFPTKIKSLDSNKDKPHLIYCTGGIRCEKAIFEMEAQGFKNVYQLEGGILNYLEQFPDRDFEGECFVFDSRVSVDQNLEPSKNYSLCPHCGDVSVEEVSCLKCDSPTKLCENCFENSQTLAELQTCSKNCRHHYKIRPGTKSPQQRQFYHED